MKKMVLVMVALSMFIGINIARAEKCDPLSSGVEFYYCKIGEKEMQQGLQKTTMRMCVEYKKISPSDGCAFPAPFSTKEDHAQIFMIGKASQKEMWRASMKFQCDNMGSHSDGGLDTQQMTESYDILPSEYYAGGLNMSERAEKFTKNLEKQGKAVFGIVEITEPANEFLRYNKQTCQFWNKGSDTVGAKFSVNVYPPKGDSSSPTVRDAPMVGEKKSTDIATPDTKGSLKKLFGK